MIADDAVPRVENIGSDGQQLSTVAALPAQEPPPFDGPLANAMVGAATNGRGFGTEMANFMVVGVTQHLTAENQRLSDRVNQSQSKLDLLTNALASAEKTVAVQRAKLSSASQSRRTAQVITFIGASLFTLGIDLVLKETFKTQGLLCLILGAALIVVPWTWRSEEES